MSRLAGPAISAYGTTDDYQQVVAKTGGQQQADEFVRLFLAPGMHHIIAAAARVRTISTA